MNTTTFLDQHGITDAQFIEITSRLGIDPSLDHLDSDQQEQILEIATMPITQAQSPQFNASIDPGQALATLQDVTSEKLEAFLDQSEQIAEEVEGNCIEVIEAVSDRITDAVQSIMPGVVQRTTEKLQSIVPGRDRVSPLGKHESGFRSRLQRLRSSRVVAGALPSGSGNRLNGSTNINGLSH